MFLLTDFYPLNCAINSTVHIVGQMNEYMDSLAILRRAKGKKKCGRGDKCSNWKIARQLKILRDSWRGGLRGAERGPEKGENKAEAFSSLVVVAPNVSQVRRKVHAG